MSKKKTLGIIEIGWVAEDGTSVPGAILDVVRQRDMYADGKKPKYLSLTYDANIGPITKGIHYQSMCRLLGMGRPEESVWCETDAYSEEAVYDILLEWERKAKAHIVNPVVVLRDSVIVFDAASTWEREAMYLKFARFCKSIAKNKKDVCLSKTGYAHKNYRHGEMGVLFRFDKLEDIDHTLPGKVTEYLSQIPGTSIVDTSEHSRNGRYYKLIDFTYIPCCRLTSAGKKRMVDTSRIGKAGKFRIEPNLSLEEAANKLSDHLILHHGLYVPSNISYAVKKVLGDYEWVVPHMLARYVTEFVNEVAIRLKETFNLKVVSVTGNKSNIQARHSSAIVCSIVLNTSECDPTCIGYIKSKLLGYCWSVQTTALPDNEHVQIDITFIARRKD